MSKYPRITTNQLKEYARARGGILISPEYKRRLKLEWKCANGHIWAQRADQVKAGHWCPVCGRGKAKQKIQITHKEKSFDKLEELKSIAKSKGGMTLDKEYINEKHKMYWQCALGHQWKTNANSIKRGSWCGACYRLRKINIDELHTLAEKNGGVCLIENNTLCTKIQWKCNKGHVWRASPNKIRKGEWCPECKQVAYKSELADKLDKVKGKISLDNVIKKAPNNKVSWQCNNGHIELRTLRQILENKKCYTCEIDVKLNKLKAAAEKFGGKCLAETYINSKTKIPWQCVNGHIWSASPESVLLGNHWCKECRGRHVPTIEEIKAIAIEKGGICLSSKYVNSTTKLEFRCNNGHTFKTLYPKLKHRGDWCPYCSDFKTEEYCRMIFEQLLLKKFPKARPSWLLSSNNSRLELDGYCKDLGIAFEYQGKQHYELVPYYHKTEQIFKDKLKIDQEKRGICKLKNILLIEVPYYLSSDKIYQFIKDELDLRSITIQNKNFNPDSIKMGNSTQLQKARDLAKTKGGFCLTDNFVTSHQIMQWQCAKGHIWKASYNKVVNYNNWCRKCGGLEKHTIQQMRDFATKKGGKCLSDKYTDLKTHILWECSKGHTWLASPNNVLRGTWCPKCNKPQQVNIEQLKELAIKKGGICLSTEYTNMFDKLSWQCAKGHIWSASPAVIKYHNSWCPNCRKN